MTLYHLLLPEYGKMATTNPYAILAALDDDDDDDMDVMAVDENARTEKRRFHQKAKGTKNVFIGHMATPMDWQWVLEEATTCGEVVSHSPVMHIQYRASLSTQTLAKGTKCYYWASVTMNTVEEAVALIAKIGKDKYRAAKKSGTMMKPRVYAEWGK
jgi:hypothetical protein